jgi:cation diffusion facilitator CzcD-associated flavoprotein CzcO
LANITSSSCIQVLPAILPQVRKVTTFIREPTWVSPVKGLEQYIFTCEEKRAFAENSTHLTEYRRGIESGMNGQWAIFLQNTEGQRSTREYMTQQMKDKLRNPALESALIPQWSVGCRRITPGVGYLEVGGHKDGGQGDMVG